MDIYGQLSSKEQEEFELFKKRKQIMKQRQEKRLSEIKSAVKNPNENYIKRTFYDDSDEDIDHVNEQKIKELVQIEQRQKEIAEQKKQEEKYNKYRLKVEKKKEEIRQSRIVQRQEKRQSKIIQQHLPRKSQVSKNIPTYNKNTFNNDSQSSYSSSIQQVNSMSDLSEHDSQDYQSDSEQSSQSDKDTIKTSDLDIAESSEEEDDYNDQVLEEYMRKQDIDEWRQHLLEKEQLKASSMGSSYKDHKKRKELEEQQQQRLNLYKKILVNESEVYDNKSALQNSSKFQDINDLYIQDSMYNFQHTKEITNQKLMKKKKKQLQQEEYLQDKLEQRLHYTTQTQKDLNYDDKIIQEKKINLINQEIAEKIVHNRDKFIQLVQESFNTGCGDKNQYYLDQGQFHYAIDHAQNCITQQDAENCEGWLKCCDENFSCATSAAKCRFTDGQQNNNNNDEQNDNNDDNNQQNSEKNSANQQQENNENGEQTKNNESNNEEPFQQEAQKCEKNNDKDCQFCCLNDEKICGTKDQCNKQSKDLQHGLYGAAICGVIVIVGFIIYKYRKKKKQKENAEKERQKHKDRLKRQQSKISENAVQNKDNQNTQGTSGSKQMPDSKALQDIEDNPTNTEPGQYRQSNDNIVSSRNNLFKTSTGISSKKLMDSDSNIRRNSKQKSSIIHGVQVQNLQITSDKSIQQAQQQQQQVLQQQNSLKNLNTYTQQRNPTLNRLNSLPYLQQQPSFQQQYEQQNQYQAHQQQIYNLQQQMQYLQQQQQILGINPPPPSSTTMDAQQQQYQQQILMQQQQPTHQLPFTVQQQYHYQQMMMQQQQQQRNSQQGSQKCHSCSYENLDQCINNNQPTTGFQSQQNSGQQRYLSSQQLSGFSQNLSGKIAENQNNINNLQISSKHYQLEQKQVNSYKQLNQLKPTGDPDVGTEQ